MLSRIAVKTLFRRQAPLAALQTRSFMDQLALQSQEMDQAIAKDGSQDVALWKDIKKAEDTSLALQTKDEIEKYAISIT